VQKALECGLGEILINKNLSGFSLKKTTALLWQSTLQAFPHSNCGHIYKRVASTTNTYFEFVERA
jgi:hypothetical protein